MPFVEAKCTKCGAILPVDNTRDAWVCGYCATPFVVEKAIQQLNITAETVVVQSSREDFDIRGGVLLKYNGSTTEVVIPEGVVEIGEGAFKDCGRITKVELPRSCCQIDDEAFRNCSSLLSITLPERITNIGFAAFAYSGLTSVTIQGAPLFRPISFGMCKDLEKVEASAEAFSKLDFHLGQEFQRQTGIHLQMQKVVGYLGSITDCPSDYSFPFFGTPWYESSGYKKLGYQRRQMNMWMQNNRCISCGGKKKKTGECKNCGKI